MVYLVIYLFIEAIFHLRSTAVSVMASLPLNYDIPSIATMRTMVQEHFGFVPCNWQVQAAQAQLKQRDVVTLSPTGSGKTLTFWIPLLFNNGGITILITPLTILGEKNVTELQQMLLTSKHRSTLFSFCHISRSISRGFGRWYTALYSVRRRAAAN
jgi:superfamily II DNA or RNA helicase